MPGMAELGPKLLLPSLLGTLNPHLPTAQLCFRSLAILVGEQPSSIRVLHQEERPAKLQRVKRRAAELRFQGLLAVRRLTPGVQGERAGSNWRKEWGAGPWVSELGGDFKEQVQSSYPFSGCGN